MKKRTLVIPAVVALVAIMATPFLFAGPGGRRMGGHGGGDFAILGILGHVREELNLSDQQTDEIKAIFRDLREQNAAYRDQFRGGMHSVLTTLIQNPNDLAAAQAILDQQAQAEKVMKTNALNATAKALSVLTPEQRTKLGTLIAERAERRRNRS